MFEFKRTGLFIILCLLILGLGVVNFAQDEPHIDVGLIYGQNNQMPIGISSQEGFVFGISEGAVFKPFVDFSHINHLNLYKKGYYVYNAQGKAELVETAQPYYESGHVKGGYSLVAQGNYETYEAAFADYQQLNSIDNQFYLTYKDAWFLTYGHFLTSEDANAKINQLKTEHPALVFDVMMPNHSKIVVYSGAKPLLAYYTSDADFVFKTSVFELNQTKYRNSLIVKRLNGSDFTAINRVTLSEYLYGVVPREVSASWHMEALKAQAVAARNYAVMNLNKYSHWEFDLCNTVSSQVYGGFSAEHPNTNRAVDETKNILLYHGEDIVQAYYHANNGGFMEQASNVWNNDLPYLMAAHDEYSMDMPNSNWTLVLTSSEVELALERAGHLIGQLTEVQILERSISGRVMKMSFIGTRGSVVLTKSQPRTVLGSTVLKSMLFGLSQDTSRNGLPIINQPPQSGKIAIPNRAVSQQGALMRFGQGNTVLLNLGNGDELYKVDTNDILAKLSKVTVQTIERVEVRDGTLTLYGHGYGHGIGMSQWGAKKMADSGHTYVQILQHYYKNTHIGTLKP